METDTEGGVVRAPLVFQCKQCRAIVGDSFSWVCSLQELESITLSGGCELSSSAHPNSDIYLTHRQLGA